MSFTQDYYKEVEKRIRSIHTEDEKAIHEAAQLLFDAECSGHKIFTFGTGHSHMIAKIYPILEIELTLLTHPTKSTHIERTADYADILETLYDVKEGDVVIAASNSGRNSLVIEYLSRLKKRGVKIIAITSLAHSKTIASRHASGLRLFELADIALDNRAPYGDATTSLSNTITMGPVSTLTSCYLSQLLIGTFVEKLIAAGHDAPVFRSSNSDGADAYNQELFDRYVIKK